MTTRIPIDDLSILSRTHLLAEAERSARQLESLKLAVIATLHEIEYGATEVVARRMLRSALEGTESIE